MAGSFPILHTQRLDLVAIEQKHLADVYRLFGDSTVTQYYNISTLVGEKDAQPIVDWFQKRFAEKAGIRWGIALKGQDSIIGTAGFNNYAQHNRANIGYDLQPQHWGNGYICEALADIINYGFTQLEINRIEAEVMQGNTNSENVLTKLGFTKEGILRDWMLWNGKHYDMSMFSLLKSKYNQ